MVFRKSKRQKIDFCYYVAGGGRSQRNSIKYNLQYLPALPTQI
jgi:hypothetical protein